jgi:hypothetical protein
VRRIELALAKGGHLVVAAPAGAATSPQEGTRVRAAFPRSALHLMEEA